MWCMWCTVRSISKMLADVQCHWTLKNYLLRPYPGRSITADTRHRRLVFNCRLSRASRIIENAFGILVAK